MNPGNINGIVLAGGKSSRLGSDKAMLIFQGKALIQHAIDILKTVCCEVMISANQHAYQFTGCNEWPDEYPVNAPMVGIYSCLKQSKQAVNIVLSCDMPLIGPGLFTALLNYATQFDVVLPVHDNGLIEPLCGIYNQRLVPLIERHIHNGQYGLKDFVINTKHKLVFLDPLADYFRPNMFININTSGDFDLLNQS